MSIFYSGLVHAKEVHDTEEVMRHAVKSSWEFSIVLMQSLADTKTSWADAVLLRAGCLECILTKACCDGDSRDDWERSFIFSFVLSRYLASSSAMCLEITRNVSISHFLPWSFRLPASSFQPLLAQRTKVPCHKKQAPSSPMRCPVTIKWPKSTIH